MEHLRHIKIQQTRQPGNLVFSFPYSIVRSVKSENGESRIRKEVVESLNEYNKAVAAPIDLPHIAIYLTFLVYLKYSTTHSTSYFS